MTVTAPPIAAHWRGPSYAPGRLFLTDIPTRSTVSPERGAQVLALARRPGLGAERARAGSGPRSSHCQQCKGDQPVGRHEVTLDYLVLDGLNLAQGCGIDPHPRLVAEVRREQPQ